MDLELGGRFLWYTGNKGRPCKMEFYNRIPGEVLELLTVDQLLGILRPRLTEALKQARARK